MITRSYLKIKYGNSQLQHNLNGSELPDFDGWRSLETAVVEQWSDHYR